MNQLISLVRPQGAVPIVRAAGGPLMIFGGPYSNLEATRAILAEAARLNIPPGRMVCTGDIVAYGADAEATAALIRDSGCHAIQGNCEESLAAGAADCGCGFPTGSACERLSAAWFAHAVKDLSAATLAWIAALPLRLDLEIEGYRFAVVHGGVRRINQFIFASTADAVKADELDAAGVDGVIGGHCGLPFTQSVGGRLWHNAGVIGMPANDGTPRAWYSLLTAGPDGIAVEHRAIEYDYAAAATKMRDAGLPDEYASALETGLWPNCDVLPLREIQARGVAIEAGKIAWRATPQTLSARKTRGAAEHLWPLQGNAPVAALDARKFRDPLRTAKDEPRAQVALRRLETLWFNTGTLCNIACRNCYIESSPRNDRLSYLTRAEVIDYLDEIARDDLGTTEIGFTGGEPFMNPDILFMLGDCLARGFSVLVLTNAMKPMRRFGQGLLDLHAKYPGKLTVRVSLDHFTAERHEDERGPQTYQPTLDGLAWLARGGFKIAVAGRTMWGDDLDAERAGYGALFARYGIPIDADDPAALILFPEMDAQVDVPEITEACWGLLGKSPADVMCASSRMIVKRKDTARPAVVACTLIPYDPAFELGATLRDAANPIPLNHPHCAKFCVLGGASCAVRATA